MSTQPGIAFRATIELGGTTATSIDGPSQPRESTVPADFIAALPADARALREDA